LIVAIGFILFLCLISVVFSIFYQEYFVVRAVICKVHKDIEVKENYFQNYIKWVKIKLIKTLISLKLLNSKEILMFL
jgi:hypothetical protein